MKRFLFIVALVAGSLALAAFTGADHAPSTRPRLEIQFGTPTEDYIARSGYVAARPTHYTPWVIEYLTSASFVKKARRDDARFSADEDTPREFRPSNRDYLHSGYDRGHIAPANDMTADPAAMKDCFLLSNMMPQTPELNRGPWRMLEEHVCRLAAGDGVEAWVATGPAWLPDEEGRVSFEALGSHHVWAPTHCWKVALVKRGDGRDAKFEAFAWLLPNDKEPPPFKDCKVSVDEIEAAAGLDLFAGLPDDLEDALEAAK